MTIFLLKNGHLFCNSRFLTAPLGTASRVKLYTARPLPYCGAMPPAFQLFSTTCSSDFGPMFRTETAPRQPRVAICIKIDELCTSIDEVCIKTDAFAFKMMIVMQTARRSDTVLGLLQRHAFQSSALRSNRGDATMASNDGSGVRF